MCEHLEFAAEVDVHRLFPTEKLSGPCRFNADVRIKCAICGVQMRFIGLPPGLDLNGATVSVDGTEGRFAIAPKGEVLSFLDDAPVGFTVRKGS